MGLRTTRAVALGLLILPALAAFAIAETPADSSGRFTMSPVDGGFLRLDKQTGAVTMCARTGNDWACKPVDDQTKAASSDELSRLEAENKELKDRVKTLEESLETGKPSPPPPGGGPLAEGPPGGKAQLPTDEEVDQALDYLSRVYKKVREHIKDLDKPLPPDEASPPPKGAL
jgi:hypothetical protein